MEIGLLGLRKAATEQKQRRAGRGMASGSLLDGR